MDSTFDIKRKLENTKCKLSSYFPVTLKGPASADVTIHVHVLQILVKLNKDTRRQEL